jgi:hypothetical protein
MTLSGEACRGKHYSGTLSDDLIDCPATPRFKSLAYQRKSHATKGPAVRNLDGSARCCESMRAQESFPLNHQQSYIPMIDSASSVVRLVRQIVTWGAFSLIPALFAASDSNTKVKEPTEVQGVVEVLNDVLREPYRKTIGGSTTAPGTFPFPGRFITLDVPVGKRLIVETISLQVKVTTNQNVLVQMQTLRGGFVIDTSVQLPVQKQGTFGGLDYLTATHSVMLRVDGTETTDELLVNVQRNAEAGSVEVAVSVYGYLVSIPPPSP